MNVVTIDKVYCKGCNLCIAVCKTAALSKGSERNTRGYLVPQHDTEACKACANCEVTCPELAVTVENREDHHA